MLNSNTEGNPTIARCRIGVFSEQGDQILKVDLEEWNENIISLLTSQKIKPGIYHVIYQNEDCIRTEKIQLE